MPIKKSAAKHLRQIKRRTPRNSQAKIKFKQFIKEVRKAVILRNGEKLSEYAGKLQKVIDKAERKKIIKPNNAARRKSRLMKQINAALQSK